MRSKFLLSALAAAAALGLSSPSQAQSIFYDGGDSYFVDVKSIWEIPFRTVVRQRFDYSCGSAAVATLLAHHYGKPVGEAEVFRAMYETGDKPRIQKVGFSLLDMKRYLAAEGFKADGYRLTLAQLEKSRSPAITVVQNGSYKHFVVIKGVRDGQVLVGDPALGLKKYSFAEFEKMWNGIAFMIREVPATQVAFNREDEWRPYAQAPLDDRLGGKGAYASFDGSVRPLYQIAPVADLQGFLE
jgi:predicted double-glycine peptidase